MGDYQQSCCSLGLHHRLPHTIYLSDGRPVCTEKEGPQGDPGKPGLSSYRWPYRRYRTEATAVRRPSHDPAAGHPDAEVLHSETDLYRQLKDWAFKSNVEIVIAALRRSVPASVKVSQNAVAASCSQALHRLYNHVEDKSLVVRDAETFFGDPSSLIYGQVSMEVIEHEGKSGFFARRAGCCLVWRTRGTTGIAPTASFSPREEQTRQFRGDAGESQLTGSLPQVIGDTQLAKNPCYISRGMTTSSCGRNGRIADYTMKENRITKALDFLQ